MIQDIAPARLDNAYAFHDAAPADRVLFFGADGSLSVREEDGVLRFPSAAETGAEGAVYLFAVDGTRFFLAPEGTAMPEGYAGRTLRELRRSGANRELLAAFTAFHLWRWYADNRFCGRCGSPVRLHGEERALQCTRCGHVIYPRINPAVIVGVIRGDCLLITRYRTGYAHNALVAGFTEIGETLEQTVEREVMEETGLRVRNIRYYKSQPWGMAQDVLAGFYCDAEEDGIRIDGRELKDARWVRREDIILQPDNLSLTQEMMAVFKAGGPFPPPGK